MSDELAVRLANTRTLTETALKIGEIHVFDNVCDATNRRVRRTARGEACPVHQDIGPCMTVCESFDMCRKKMSSNTG